MSLLLHLVATPDGLSSSAVLRQSGEKGTNTVNCCLLYEFHRGAQFSPLVLCCCKQKYITTVDVINLNRHHHHATVLSGPQLPGELHGGCSRRLHAGQQASRAAGHHPSSNLRRTHAHHLPAGQTSETDNTSSAGGGGGAR